VKPVPEDSAKEPKNGNDEEITEKIEEIVERKVEQKTKQLEQKVQKLQKENRKLRKKTEEKNNETEAEESSVSRREFLKKAGLGAMGLGAMALTPASAFQVKDKRFNVQTGSDAGSLSEAMNIDSSGNVSIPNGNLALGTGQAIEDGSGTSRLSIKGNRTQLLNEDGDLSLQLKGGSGHELVAYSNTPAGIYDSEGSFTAVQYDTDASAGVLRTPNAGIRVEDNGYVPSSGSGLDLRYVASNSQSYIRSYDAGNSDYDDLIIESGTLELVSRDGLIDLSDGGTNPANLRLAAGQSIEDGSGTRRVRLLSNGTFLENENGELGLELKEGIAHRITAQSNEPVEIFDREFTEVAVQYSTGDPGTLELTNAELHIKNHTESDWVSAIDYRIGSGGLRWRAGYNNNNHFEIYDELNDESALAIEFGGKAHVRNRNLRLDTGQAIEDGNGTNRVGIRSGNTALYDEDGNPSFNADSTGNTSYARSGGFWRVYDAANTQDAIKYTVGNPGTLELTNANLDVKGNKLNLPQVSGSPSSTSTGDIWYDTSAD
jgi:hypothetical protein